MSSNEFMRDFLIGRRKRLIGAIMSHAETRIYPRLSEEERHAFRSKVLESVGAYHDACLDLLTASVDTGSVVNQEALRLLRQIHDRVGA